MEIRIVAALLLACSSGGAYVRAPACAACHPKQHAAHARSGHAGALWRAAEHPLADSVVGGSGGVRKPNYRFQFLRGDGGVRVRASDGADVVDIPVEWAFGAGVQAVTFVTRVNEEWYLEHYLSYYPATRQLAATPGQEAAPADTLQRAMGVLYKTLDPEAGIVGCFECHSTGPLGTGPGGEIRPAELGVRCEACHGPGEAHVKAAGRAPMRNSGRMTAAELNEFCGKCHRPPAAKGVKIDWNYAWNVRHQPVYLSQSACFRKSNGALSCLSCHDPHGPLRRNDAAYYDARCGGCHNAKTRPPKPVCLKRQPADCADCHMPSVAPQAGLRFTNHWIGLYGEGAKLKPVRPGRVE